MHLKPLSIHNHKCNRVCSRSKNQWTGPNDPLTLYPLQTVESKQFSRDHKANHVNE